MFAKREKLALLFTSFQASEPTEPPRPTVLRGLREDKEVQGGHTAGEQKIARDYKLSVKQNFTVRVTQQPGTS